MSLQRINPATGLTVRAFPPIIVLPAGFSNVCIVGPDDEVLVEYLPVVSRRERFAQPAGAIRIRPRLSQ
jgi:hypothetical protein